VITNATGAATSSVATLNVRASVDTLTWRGAANANWDLTSLNWSNMNTLANGVIYESGDNVTIGDGGANYNINLTAGLYPSSVTNSTASTSSFGGVGFLGGPMNLVKNGTGTFAISNANVFTGTVTVNAGILRVGNGSALGSTTAGTTINGGATLDLNGQSLGSEPITVQGNGFGGTNGAINDTGPQQQSAISSLSLAGDTMINAPGQRWDFYTNGSSTSFQGNGYKLPKIGANVVYIKDAGNTGLGDIFVSGAGGIGFQGNIGLGDPTKTITCSNSTLNLYATASPLSKNLVLSNSSTLYNGGGTTASLYGTVTFVGTNTINNANEVDLYGGISGSTGGLTKNGSANLYLYGTNTYPGSTVINGGQVIVGSTGSILAGPVVQLATNTTLDVSATAQGLTIGAGQSLIGLGASATAATVSGNVTNRAGSTLNPGLNGPGNLPLRRGDICAASRG